MPRTVYPGLTARENSRRAKHDYLTDDEPDAERGICVVVTRTWHVGPAGEVARSYHLVQVKDAHSGRLLTIDTRDGGHVLRRAPYRRLPTDVSEACPPPKEG